MPKKKLIPEKRYTRRFPLRLPVQVHPSVSEQEALGGSVVSAEETDTETLNISAGGVQFYMDSEIAVGAQIEFTIAMSAQALGAPADVRVNCVGRVVRRRKRGEHNLVAAIIDEYRFERA